MPSLDYANGVPLSTGAHNGAAHGLYGTRWERVRCPDCGQWADAEFGGDHSGTCLNYAVTAAPNTALGAIRKHALKVGYNGRFSANDVRLALDALDVASPKRGPAFAAAERKGWIEHVGYERSTDPATKGHPVSVYRSLIPEPRKARP